MRKLVVLETGSETAHSTLSTTSGNCESRDCVFLEQKSVSRVSVLELPNAETVHVRAARDALARADSSRL